MILTHPVDCLKLYDLDTSTLDMMNPPPMFLGGGSAETRYMPVLKALDVIEKVRFQKLENGEFKFFYRLNREVNDIWLRLFTRYHLRTRIPPFKETRSLFAAGHKSRQVVTLKFARTRFTGPRTTTGRNGQHCFCSCSRTRRNRRGAIIGRLKSKPNSRTINRSAVRDGSR